MSELKFAKSHEGVKEISAGKVQVGISEHAQEAMGDLVFVNLPEVGDSLEIGDVFADLESVKAVSDIYSPASGIVSAINEELLDAPETINQNAYEAWLIELDNVTELSEELMSEEEYQAYIAAEEA